VVRDAELAVETVLTNGEGVDHPSAISLLGPDPLDARARLLVVYDNPSADRRPWADTVLADRVRIGAGDDGSPEPFDADDTDEDPGDVDPGDVDPGDGLAPVDLAFVDTVGPVDVLSPDDELDEEPDEEPDDETDVDPDDPAVPDDRPPLDVLADEPAPVDHRHATVLLPDHLRSIDS
jgi:hypothetical protein